MMDPVAEYLGTLEAERGVSRNTLAAYRRDLHDFLRFVNDTGKRVDTIDADDVLTYVGRLRRRGLASASVLRRLSALRGFYGHLRREGAVGGDNAAPARGPEGEKSFDPDEIPF